MHIRRALLLFAVVLGLAALAASLSRPARKSDQPAPITTSPLPELSPSPAAGGPERLRFSEGGKREREALQAGRSAVVTVKVRERGQVELEGLGLTAAAEPLTPARFDVLASEPGRHDVRFLPSAGEPILIGVLKVTQASR
jgi:hypothetical protein